MTSESNVRSLAGPEQSSATRQHRQATLSGFARLISDNRKLLVLGPIVAGVIAFGLESALPKWYTSTAYLALDENDAKAADLRMRSTLVLDKVIGEVKVPGATLEARRRYIDGNRRIVMPAGAPAKAISLFRMEFADRDPAIAQKINLAFIEAWLESTRPPPDKRAMLEAELQRTELQAKSLSQLIERLEKDSPSLLAQNSWQGELATPISGLIAKRDENLASLIGIRNSLKGISRDVVFAAPDLPEEPSWPRQGVITVLAASTTILLLLLFVILRWIWVSSGTARS